MGLRMDLIPKKGIKIDEKHDILIGMSKETILNTLGKPELIKQTNYIYPDKATEISERFYYENIWLVVELKNNQVVFLETSRYETFYFKNTISLAKENFKTTLRELEKIGYVSVVDEDDTYIFNDLNFFMYINNEELESLGIFSDGYFEKITEKIKERFIKYDVKFKMEKGIDKYIYTLKESK